MYTNIYTWMFTTVLFIAAKKLNQSKFLSIDEWICNIHTYIICNIITQWNFICQLKKIKEQVYAMIWLMQNSERNQLQKIKYYMIQFI